MELRRRAYLTWCLCWRVSGVELIRAGVNYARLQGRGRTSLVGKEKDEQESPNFIDLEISAYKSETPATVQKKRTFSIQHHK
jgi:hypothetical protein